MIAQLELNLGKNHSVSPFQALYAKHLPMAHYGVKVVEEESKAAQPKKAQP